MSSERPYSPVWDDVMRVWTDPRGVAEAGLREGRGWAEWWRVLVLYGLVFAFSLVISNKLGSDKLLDYFWGGSDSAPDESATSAFIWAALVSLAMSWFALWWLLAPRFAGWFGGSTLRRDASLAFYFSFCVCFFVEFASGVADVISVSLQRFAYPTGSWFYLGTLVLMIAIPWHQFARIAQRVLFLPTYGRAIGMVTVLALVSLAIALALIVLIGFVVLHFHPTLLD